MNIPIIGTLVPQTSSILRKIVGRTILFLHRWQIKGSVHNTSKFMFAIAPHTSYWDFISSIGTMLSMGLKSQWFIADVFCWWPIGYLMRWLGGLPIDRTTRHDIVSKMITKYKEEEELLLSIYPEGTTHKTEKWKTGFWHIAKGAGVPIQLVGLDYKKRATVFGPILELSENIESDIKIIQRYYKDIAPKCPEKFYCEP